MQIEWTANAKKKTLKTKFFVVCLWFLRKILFFLCILPENFCGESYIVINFTANLLIFTAFRHLFCLRENEKYATQAAYHWHAINYDLILFHQRCLFFLTNLFLVFKFSPIRCFHIIFSCCCCAQVGVKTSLSHNDFESKSGYLTVYKSNG